MIGVKLMSGTWGLNLFDRLHIGHQVMIDRLSEMPDPIACVTGGELVGFGLELENLIQPIELRERNLRNYIQRTNLDDIIAVKSVTKYTDLFSIKGDATFVMYEGPCCTEIESGALNIRKEKMGVSDTIEFLKPVRAHDGEKIASARIRLGEIDREGRRLRGTDESPRELPQGGRAFLKTPKGEVFAAKDGPPEKRVVSKIREDSPDCVIAVGDVTVSTILKEDYTPKVMIVDGITKRGPFEEQFTAERVYTIFNPQAVIYPEAWSVIDTAIHDDTNSLIIVEGEEDLMGFPAVLLAPDDSAVLYGQPDVGIVWIPVNEENRKIARDLLEQMPIIKS
ncbi:MAG: hypothetical protein ThorAB25_08210 [Candidatus Thorarchaeota archaeon AB_25]|nr:MAG: hypothetical protein ThorAB25_08210 [Candidatus Thorarchaeota archaeon AB_25]